MLYGVFAVLVIIAIGYVFDPFAGPRYRGPRSDHFDGKRFFLRGSEGQRGLRDFLRWQLTTQRGAWPAFVETAYGPPPPARVDGENLRVTFINHSTALIQTAGLNILTDPVWSNRVGPVSWAGLKRHQPPGLSIEDLPRIDIILLTHNHYDHLDLPTLRRIVRTHEPKVVAPLGVRALLESKNLGCSMELDWWITGPLRDGVQVTCVPAQHFSARGLRDYNNTLWCGYVLEVPEGRIYFAGDTGYGPHIGQIAQRFAPLRLALLPIGAYRPEWFMSPVHMSPEQAVRVHQIMGATTSLAIHFGTFALGDDGQMEAATCLRRALEDGDAARFWVLEHGEGRDVPLGGAPNTAHGTPDSLNAEK